MEVVETLTFWCPHVERAACTNFSPRTVELQPPESREIFPFPFSSFSFSFLSPYEFFSFLFVFFFSFSSFLSFSFSHFSSHSPFNFSPFSFCTFSSFLEHTTHQVQKGNFLPISSNQMCGPQFSIFIPYFIIPLYDIITTWLNMSHGIHFPHMANCEPFL